MFSKPQMQVELCCTSCVSSCSLHWLNIAFVTVVCVNIRLSVTSSCTNTASTVLMRSLKHYSGIKTNKEAQEMANLTYSGDTQFVSRPRHQISCLTTSVGFLSSSRKTEELYINFGHFCFLAYTFKSYIN
jgi:hypothetical protein